MPFPILWLIVLFQWESRRVRFLTRYSYVVKRVYGSIAVCLSVGHCRPVCYTITVATQCEIESRLQLIINRNRNNIKIIDLE